MSRLSGFINFISLQGMGRAFRHRDFTLFALAGLMANIGMWLQRIGVQWLTWEITGSYAWLGAMAFADAIAIMIFLPIFGTVADRKNRLVLARISQSLLMLLTIGLAALTLSGNINVYGLLLFMTLHGVFEGFWTPVRMAMAPSLVPREDLSAAIGIGSLFFNMAQFIGPAVAGLLIALFADRHVGIGFLFVITGFSYLGYLVVLFIIHLKFEETRSGPRGSFLGDFREGLVYVARMPGLALFMAMMLVTTIIMRAFRELLAGVADGVFAAGPEGLAVLTSSLGIGAVLGSLVIANYKSAAGMTRLVLISFAAAIVFQFGFALAPAFWFAALCTAGLGITVAVGGIGSQVLVQSSIHGDMRGRVMSLWSIIVRGSPAIGAWAIGILTDIWQFQLVMTVATSIYLVFFLAMLPKARGLSRALESPPEER
ncbi:MAG: MFS transporter [Rhodospirillales bacterium]|nr:MFS transporter [Rhodospirillales bacterium]